MFNVVCFMIATVVSLVSNLCNPYPCFIQLMLGHAPSISNTTLKGLTDIGWLAGWMAVFLLF